MTVIGKESAPPMNHPVSYGRYSLYFEEYVTKNGVKREWPSHNIANGSSFSYGDVVNHAFFGQNLFPVSLHVFSGGWAEVVAPSTGSSERAGTTIDTAAVTRATIHSSIWELKTCTYQN